MVQELRTHYFDMNINKHKELSIKTIIDKYKVKNIVVLNKHLKYRINAIINKT